jgi:hypothetical protein
MANKTKKDSTDIKYTKKHQDYVKKLDSLEKTKGQKPVEKSGVSLKNGVATAKPYEKKFVDRKHSAAMVVDASGKVVKQAASGKPSANKELYGQYKKDSASTMESRNKAANFYNVTRGTKKELTAKDKETLLRLGKAVKKK